MFYYTHENKCLIFNFTPLKIKKVSEMEFTLSAALFKEFEGYVYRLSWFMNTIDSIMASLELTPEGIVMFANDTSLFKDT